MVMTAKGQITIPQSIRLQLGLLPECEIEFEVEGDAVKVRKAPGSGRGKRLVALLAGRATSGLSTDEILAHTRGEE